MAGDRGNPLLLEAVWALGEADFHSRLFGNILRAVVYLKTLWEFCPIDRCVNISLLAAVLLGQERPVDKL